MLPDQESLEYLFHMESNCRGLGRFHKGYRKFPSVVRGNSPLEASLVEQHVSSERRDKGNG